MLTSLPTLLAKINQGNRVDPRSVPGITGTTKADGWAASCRIVWEAGRLAELFPKASRSRLVVQ